MSMLSAETFRDPETSLWATALSTISTVRRKLGPIQPQEGPQHEFVYSDIDEILFGGSVGGGKSLGLIAIPLLYTHHPALRAVIIRRSTPDLEDLLLKARRVYKTGLEGIFGPACPDVEFRGDKNIYTFPSGARVEFGHCNLEKDWENYAGQEYQIINFDELPHFTEEQYLEICKRLRASVPGLPRLIRATGNPPKASEPGYKWIKKRWGPWLDENFTCPDWTETEILEDGTTRVIHGTGLPPRLDERTGETLPPATSGMPLYVGRFGDKERFSSTPFPYADSMAPSRTFIVSRMEHNQALMKNDPGYRARVRDDDPVRAAQLEKGDWRVEPGPKKYFNVLWCGPRLTIYDVPQDIVSIRSWDLAATEVSRESPDPDWTVGVRMDFSPSQNLLYVTHVIRERLGPGGVRNLVADTAKSDGYEVGIFLPIDPGQAGKDQASQYQILLRGYRTTMRKMTGDKITRFGGFSSFAHPVAEKQGRVRIVDGDWPIEDYVRVLENLGGKKKMHDDDADASGDGFVVLMGITDGTPVEVETAIVAEGGESGKAGQAMRQMKGKSAIDEAPPADYTWSGYGNGGSRGGMGGW